MVSRLPASIKGINIFESALLIKEPAGVNAALVKAILSNERSATLFFQSITFEGDWIREEGAKIEKTLSREIKGLKEDSSLKTVAKAILRVIAGPIGLTAAPSHKLAVTGLDGGKNNHKQVSEKFVRDLIKEAHTCEFSMRNQDNFDKVCNQLREVLFDRSASRIDDKSIILGEIVNGARFSDIVFIIINSDNAEYNENKTLIARSIRKRMEGSSDRDQRLYNSIKRFESYLHESKAGVFQRKPPRFGLMYNMPVFDPVDWLIFLDSEIISRSQVLTDSRLTNKRQPFIKKSISEHNKVVLHQAAIESAGQTCVCMLLLDRGLKTPIKTIYNGYGSRASERLRMLEGAGISASSHTISSASGAKFLLELKNHLETNGSAITYLVKNRPKGRRGNSSHYVVCDHISEDLKSVRLRDPWHGWEITVKAEAFLQRVDVEKDCYHTTIEQVVAPPLKNQSETKRPA